ncbi:MAG: hypothetical protein HOI23_17940 [Deltaproteobacteria bacterium]|nr:hypothetical protein [Deltaproteobacteria bacterium]
MKTKLRRVLSAVCTLGLALVLSGCFSQNHGRCVDESDSDEAREWVWIYENMGIAANRKCILCYLDGTDPNDRCYYVYNEDFLGNRTKDTCKQYACSDEPGTGDAWQQGHGGQGMIDEFFAAYQNE